MSLYLRVDHRENLLSPARPSSVFFLGHPNGPSDVSWAMSKPMEFCITRAAVLHSHGGTAKTLDGCCERETPIYKWIITWGPPIVGNLVLPTEVPAISSSPTLPVPFLFAGLLTCPNTSFPSGYQQCMTIPMGSMYGRLMLT